MYVNLQNKQTMMSQRYLQAHCQSRTSPSKDQSFVKWSEAEFVNINKINM